MSVVVGAAEATGTVLASRSDVVGEIAQNGLRISQTVADRMSDIGRFVPPSAVKAAIETGAAFNDTQGASNTVTFLTTVDRNGSQVGVKVVYDLINKMVVHVHFDDVDKLLTKLLKVGAKDGF